MKDLSFNRRKILKSSTSLIFLGALSDLYSQEKKNYTLPAKAKHLIYLSNSGGQSQLDMYDHKPELMKWQGREIPKSVIGNNRLTTMTSDQGLFSIKASDYKFRQDKKSGLYLSDLIPEVRNVSDEICLIKSMHTEEINHDPAMCHLLTGSPLQGKASLGAWIDYGLGSLNKNLPSFVVMNSRSSRSNQSINDRFWGNGFLPSEHQGTPFQNTKNPVMFLNSPKFISSDQRASQIELIKKLNDIRNEEKNDPEIIARTKQYELAFRMQSAVPDAVDMSKETESTFELYGPDSRKPGTYAYNCLMARKLIEKGVRTVNLFHRTWDHHSNLADSLPKVCKDTDRANAALIKDLKQRGLLDETLVVCGGEFGRTPFSQGSYKDSNYGRDHHNRCFSIWLAGAGIKKGFEYGKTDEFSYNVTENPVSIEELNATILLLMGIDNNKLSYFSQGLEQKLTGVENIKPVKEILL